MAGVSGISNDGGCYVQLSPRAIALLVDNAKLNGKNSNVMTIESLQHVSEGFEEGVKMESTAMVFCPSSKDSGNPLLWCTRARAAVLTLPANADGGGDQQKLVCTALLSSLGAVATCSSF